MRRQRQPIAVLALAMVVWSPPLSAQSDVEGCRVIGRVIDAELGNPIGGVSVWIEREGAVGLLGGTATSSDGTFSIDIRVCGAGTIELRTRMIGYTDAFASMAFDGTGQVMQVTVRLERAPVELEELRVEVPTSFRLQQAGFYARKEWVASTGRDYADFYDPDEVVGRSAAFHNVGAMVKAARINFMYPRHSLCSGPSFYIDGHRFKRRYNFVEWLNHRAKLRDIEGIEIYRPVHSAIPEGFREPNSVTCGAVLIWTKSGAAEAVQIEVELCEPSSGLNLGGLVTDRLTGVRVPAAYVTLVTQGGNAASEKLQAISDADGRYRYCGLEVAPVSIQARYGGVAGRVRRFGSALAASDAFDLEIAITRPGAIIGRVFGPGVVPDSTVLALEGTDWRTTLDEDGLFGFHEVPPGNYTLTATIRGQVALRREVAVRSDHTEELELEIKGGGTAVPVKKPSLTCFS